MRGKFAGGTRANEWLKADADEAIPRKYKIPDYQNGQVYLTSHRICYVDNQDPRKNSTAIDLKEVDRYEFYVCLGKPAVRISPLITPRLAS